VEAAACARPATGYTYARREPEETALYKVLQQHLLTFEQEWTDKKLLGQVVRIFADTVAAWCRRRHADRGLAPGETGAVTVIQRANSDLRLNPHLHTIFLDGVYSPDSDGKGQMFHPAPAPTQDEVEALVGRVSKRILRLLHRRGVITLVTAPGDGEVTVIADETMGEKDPLMASDPRRCERPARPTGSVQVHPAPAARQ
jgi:Putative transposase